MKDIFMNSISSEEIALFLKEKLIGKNIILFGVSSINNLKKNTLSFISNFLYTNAIIEYINKKKAKCLIFKIILKLKKCHY